MPPLAGENPENPENPDGSPHGLPPAGEPLDAMVAAHYPALRELAHRIVRQRQGERLVDPTELVHETYLRLARQTQASPSRRTAFLALAATVVRTSLVDLARQVASLKRGGHLERVTLDGKNLLTEGELDLLALDDALVKLARLDARQARVVELKFFGGLTIEEIATSLGSSARTVNDDWKLARAWLHRELGA